MLQLFLLVPVGLPVAPVLPDLCPRSSVLPVLECLEPLVPLHPLLVPLLLLLRTRLVWLIEVGLLLLPAPLVAQAWAVPGL